VIAITAPISTKITIRTCTAIQKRGSSIGSAVEAGPPPAYSIIAWRSAIATA
jgi:hypothetical protein